MLAIAICDDDDFFPRHIELIMKEILRKFGSDAVFDKFETGEQLIDSVGTKRKVYDLILLDVEMPGE